MLTWQAYSARTLPVPACVPTYTIPVSPVPRCSVALKALRQQQASKQAKVFKLKSTVFDIIILSHNSSKTFDEEPDRGGVGAFFQATRVVSLLLPEGGEARPHLARGAASCPPASRSPASWTRPSQTSCPQGDVRGSYLMYGSYLMGLI